MNVRKHGRQAGRERGRANADRADSLEERARELPRWLARYNGTGRWMQGDEERLAELGLSDRQFAYLQVRSPIASDRCMPVTAINPNRPW